MVTISKKHTSHLPEMKKKVQQWHNYFMENNRRFNSAREFVFKSPITDSDRQTLIANDRPEIQINTLKPFLSRQLGEFSKQTPSLKVRARNDNVDPQQVEITEGIIRSILNGSDENSLSYQLYKESMSGGYSVAKVYTEYQNEDSFDQEIRVRKSFDPTMCGFDPLASESHKGDGQYAFELIPKSKEEFQAEYPDADIDKIEYAKDVNDFGWAFSDNGEKVIVVCDFFEKKDTYKEIVLLSMPLDLNPSFGPELFKLNGKTTITKQQYSDIMCVWEKLEVIALPPQIKKTRKRKETRIVNYKFVGSCLIEKPELTDFCFLPLVFIQGESIILKNSGRRCEYTIPYVLGAVDAQRIKNLTASSIVNDIENMRQTDILMSERALPSKKEYQEPWVNPQKAKGTFIFNDIDKDNPEIPVPAPTVIPRGQIQQSVIAMYGTMDNTIQSSLGSYDAQMGVQTDNLSGAAIDSGATQSNSAVMPYIIGYLSGLNQIARIIVSLIPKYYVTQRTVPIIDDSGKDSYRLINQQTGQMDDPENVNMNYNESDLDVIVKPGANFEVQKNRALEATIKLAQVSSSLNQIINQNPAILVDNLDIRGQDQLKKMAEQFTQQQQQQQQQQAQQPNPQMMEMQLKQQQQQQDNQFKTQQIQLQAQKQQAELALEKEKLRIQEQQQQIDLHNAQIKSAAEMVKARAEETRADDELDVKRLDVIGKHADKVSTGVDDGSNYV